MRQMVRNAKPTAKAARGAVTRLGRSFFARPADELARMLIGALVVRVLDDGSRLVGRIVETEAYMGIADQGCHSFAGRRTPRVESMYGPAGTAYIYFTYGMHFCFNVVAGEVDEPVAVLIRALEPVEGVETMQRRRGGDRADAELCRGPACICMAFALDRALNGVDMVRDERLYIAFDALSAARRSLHRTARIGLRSAGKWADARLRWLVRGNPCVSKPPPGHPRPRRSAQVKAGRPECRQEPVKASRRARRGRSAG